MKAVRILFASLAAIATTLIGCTNSDDYLFDESEATFIEVSTEIATSFDTNSVRTKSDTLLPTDTVIFIANILPTKSIKIKHYYWTLDGEHFSYDFSFRSAIEKPGEHDLAFILETLFGDTLSDTLHIWVSRPPVMVTDKFIPAPGAQELNSVGGISFAWEAYDPDSIAKLRYHFVIDSVIDTIVSEPYFTYWKSLPALHHYNWRVQAINEYGMVSKQEINGNFFTAGVKGESGISGHIKFSAKESGLYDFTLGTTFTILDTNGTIVRKDSVSGKSRETPGFTIAPIEAGTYRIIRETPDFPDFSADTLKIRLTQNQVLLLDTLTIQDTIPPRITSIESEGDTLTYADTLKFIVNDGGSPSLQKSTSVYLESTSLGNWDFSGDTLSVILPETARTWNTRQLGIVVTDASRNKAIRNFVIEPGESWFVTNRDSEIASDSSFSVFIIDRNPYGFTPERFIFDFGTKQETVIANESKICSMKLSPEEIPNGTSQMRSGILYTNGIVQWKKWTLVKKTSTGGEP